MKEKALIFIDGVPEKITQHKQDFLHALQSKGFQLRLRILKSRVRTCSSCKKREEYWVQKGVDVSLATDILRHAWQNTCDICILVSGDEDYKDAVECAKDKGLKVWVVSFKRNLSKDLRNIADKVFLLDELFEEIKL
ncbi:MAG: NYN domain-containing protein [Candidatus Diapherotrites archaeon]|nr:NYN domain-containing protein [Candidatus Diapherotrites archaeon]